MDNRSKEIDIAAEGTCKWLFLHETYRRWSACDRGLLWIKGSPGSGKSTLLRYALDNITETPNIGDRPFVLTFFFHGRGAELQRTPLGLFRSLLHQVLSQVPNALPDLVTHFQQQCDEVGKSDEKWQWHLRELQHFFKSSLPKILESRSVWLFVDALDECGERNAVSLVEEFKSMLYGLPSTGSQFRICFTCRQYPILDLDHGFEICVEHKNGQDIETYIQAQLSAFRVRTSSTIPALITRRASGVFMWAHLVVKQVLDLERRGVGLKGIEKAIYAVPDDLDKLYNKLVRDMDERSASLKLIQWICFAARPLSLDELRWAMVVEADGPCMSLRECQSKEDYVRDRVTMERRVKTLSCGLAEAIMSSNRRVVQFIHQSVKDFFIEKGMSALEGSLMTTDLVIGSAHYRLSRTCIRFLAMEEIAPSTTHNRARLMSDFPLLHYATTSWVAHVSKSEDMKQSQDDLLAYFDWPSERLVQLWVWLYGILEQYSDACPSKGTRMLHIVARYRLIGPLQVILRKTDQVVTDINAKDDFGQTPLSLAAENGHEAVVKLLLAEDGVDINSKDRYGWTPLSWAVKYKYEVVIKLLLAKDGVDINAKDGLGRTPLSLAAGNGHAAVIKLLLAEEGVDINSKSSDSRTPLLLAIENKHEAAVKLLLSKDGVDVNCEGKYGWTPLSWAAENGNEEVVKLVLAKDDVDVNFKDSFYGRRALSWAVKNNHEAVVKLLLAKDAVDINSRDRDRWTPLSWAVNNDHEAIIKLLLAKDGVDGSSVLWWAAEKGCETAIKLLLAKDGVDINSKDGNGRTPLSLAAGNGHDAVIKLLLANDRVDINSEDIDDRTALSWAMKKKHDAVVKLLLAKGGVDGLSALSWAAEMDGADGRTALSWAAEKGYETVIKMLLAKDGVDINFKDGNGRTPLSLAAGNGHEVVIKLLLAKDRVDIRSEDSDGRTALSWAMKEKHDAVVKLLLAKDGIDGLTALSWAAEMDGADGRTALSWAAEKGYETVIKLLLAKDGVDINSKDGDSWTPLSWAASYGHEAVIKLMLEKGADPDPKDSNGWTPLLLAASYGHDAVVKLLLTRDRVDVNSKDTSYGRTPLLCAAGNGHEAVVKLLLAKNGVNVNSKDIRYRGTPLSYAAREGHETVVKLLLASDEIDINSKDVNGWTPLVWAVENKHEAVGELLLAKDGVDGWTALS